MIAVGRLKRGPESDLAGRYADRIARGDRGVGLAWSGVMELPESKSSDAPRRKAEEAGAILDRVPSSTRLVALDERGDHLDSVCFARLLGDERDAGGGAMVFAIGGPDGHGDAVRDNAFRTIAFGRLTWPHQITRVLLLEQIYRATTILSGHPYHRG